MSPIAGAAFNATPAVFIAVAPAPVPVVSFASPLPDVSVAPGFVGVDRSGVPAPAFSPSLEFFFRPSSSLSLVTRQWRGLERQIDRLMARFALVEGDLPSEIRGSYHREFEEIIHRLGFWSEARETLEGSADSERSRYEEDIRIGQSLLGDRLLRFAALVFSEPLPDEGRTTRGLRNRLLNRRGPKLLPRPPRERPEGLEALINRDVGYGRALELRYHQEEGHRAIQGWLESQRDFRENGLADPRFLEATVVMPVGGGKTRLMAAAFAAAAERGVFRPGDKLIAINHTDKIHAQNLEVLQRLKPYLSKKLGRPLRITAYKAETKDLSGDVIVISVPTLNSPEKRAFFASELRKALEKGRIAMAAVDEVHHLSLGLSSGREMWRELLKTLREVDPSFFQIGFTATPTGREGRVIYRVREQELMQTGVTPRTYLVRVEGVDLTQLKVAAATGDFETRELVSTLLAHPKRNERLYQALEDKGVRNLAPSPSGRSRLEAVLAFGADLRHAESLMKAYENYFGGGSGDVRGRKLRILGGEKGRITRKDWEEALEDYRLGRADAVIALVSGRTSIRDEVLEAVARGEVEAVFTVDALVEGADLHMFRHQLGGRPTFSRIKKGQERGRINRRAPDEVGPKGELKSDPPRILFDVIDRYHSQERSLVRYGDMMGIPHAGMASGELLDAMKGEAVGRVDREGASIRHHDPEFLPPERPLPEAPATGSPLDSLAAMLRDLLAARYENDVGLLALDLGESEEFVEGLLKGEGWEKSRWFFRRLATLLYQERETFVKAWDRAWGREEKEKRSFARIDEAKMLRGLRSVLERAEAQGERLTPLSVADRAHAAYAAGLGGGEPVPHQGTFRHLIALSEKQAHPEARAMLEASPVVVRRRD